MNIDASLLDDSPLWNREVAQFLSDVPLFSRHDNPNRHRRLHVQPGYEIDICHQGQGVASVGGRMFRQAPGSLLVIPGHVPHQIFPDLSKPYKRTVICFDDRALRDRLQFGPSNAFDFGWLADSRFCSIRLEAEPLLDIKALSAKMCEEVQRRAKGWETMALSHLLGIAVLLQRWREMREPRPFEDADGRHYVAACCDYIAGHLHEDLSLPTMAGLLSISPEQLIRSFKREKGMTYYRYVQLQRVRESKKLLGAYPDMAITEIAFRLGFGSSSQFNRVFKAFARLTPTEYRNREREKPNRGLPGSVPLPLE